MSYKEKLLIAIDQLPETSDEIAAFLEVRHITGYQVASTSCPLAVYLSGEVGRSVVVGVVNAAIHGRFLASGVEVPLPLAAVLFVLGFDSDEYPQLKAAGR